MATIKICDVCGSDERVKTVEFWEDRHMDGSGHMDDEHEMFDLCVACELLATKRVLNESLSKKGINTVLQHRFTGPLYIEVIKKMH